MSRLRSLLAPVAAIVVVGAAVVLIWSGVSTSSAQLTASTGTEGLFAAGTVSLDREGGLVNLLFDVDGLVPGRVATGCVVVDYHGSLPAVLRLHGERVGGDGLDEFVDIRLWQRRAASCPSVDSRFDTGAAVGGVTGGREEVFTGRLANLWRQHPDYATGLELPPALRAGDQLVIEAEVELVSDDAAQGKTTEFNISLEARP